MTVVLPLTDDQIVILRAVHGRQNRSGRPGNSWTNVFSIVPERLADAISEVLNSKNRQLGRRMFLITRQKHVKHTIEFLCKTNGVTLTLCSSFFCPFPLCQTSQQSQVRLLVYRMRPLKLVKYAHDLSSYAFHPTTSRRLHECRPTQGGAGYE